MTYALSCQTGLQAAENQADNGSITSVSLVFSCLQPLAEIVAILKASTSVSFSGRPAR